MKCKYKSKVLKTFAAALLVLTGCSQKLYMPLSEARHYHGYRERPIDSSRYRVFFAGYCDTPQDTVEYYALLRASEITLAHDFDFFILESSHQDSGILTDGDCWQPPNIIDTILLMKGTPPQTANTYDAHALHAEVERVK